MAPPDPDPASSSSPSSQTRSQSDSAPASSGGSPAEADTDPDPGDGAPGDGDGEGHGEGDGNGDGDQSIRVTDGPAGREVVVPLALYKRVTVFSTLFAIVSVVLGFVLLDAATDSASLPVEEVQPVLALAGIGLIALGGLTYAFSTRFRTPGMGRSKADEDPPSDNG